MTFWNFEGNIPIEFDAVQSIECKNWINFNRITCNQMYVDVGWYSQYFHQLHSITNKYKSGDFLDIQTNNDKTSKW